MKKLVCDRFGNEISDKYDVEAIFEGAAAWETSKQARNEEPRGFIPCKNYRNCGGEMVDAKTKRKGVFGLGGNSD